MILVDDAIWPHRGRRWCHCVSDVDLDELSEFARTLDVPRRGFQGDHYDLPAEVREVALDLGAMAVPSRELLRRLKRAGLRMTPEQRRAWRPVERRLEPEAWLGRKVAVKVDRPLGRRYALGSGTYPVNVGAVGEADAYLLGVDEPVARGEGRVVAVLARADDVEDRLVVAASGSWDARSVRDATAFHERLFATNVITGP